MKKLRILQYFILLVLPITLFILLIPYTGFAFLLLASVVYLLSNVFKEYNYKNGHNEIPYKGFHLLLFRKINKFTTTNGALYYTYHQSDGNKDIIRMFKRVRFGYKLIGYEVFFNNKNKSGSIEKAERVLKGIYHEYRSDPNVVSKYDLKVDYIGTEEEIAMLKRNSKLEDLNIG